MALIGITMRIVQDANSERRDALARDWGRFMAAVGVDWIPLPNSGPATTRLVTRLGVTGLLLSGGDDIGATPERDETETALLALALADGLPVLGVCRGMQMLQHWFGGRLGGVEPERHVRRRHVVRLMDGTEREVNSYHRMGILPEDLAPDLTPDAICAADGSVEGVICRTAPLRGILWHPEREREPDPADVALCRSHWRLS